ncbi:hypothetical protein JTB14_004085 [Gonioctena quinquepunctata]|nr:hypothetical protein JTB14_004085 [Gonioctena quinquepunctata]
MSGMEKLEHTGDVSKAERCLAMSHPSTNEKKTWLLWNLAKIKCLGVLVGAPEAQSGYQDISKGVFRGGAVFKCRTDADNTCEEVPFDRTGNFQV